MHELETPSAVCVTQFPGSRCYTCAYRSEVLVNGRACSSGLTERAYPILRTHDYTRLCRILLGGGRCFLRQLTLGVLNSQPNHQWVIVRELVAAVVGKPLFDPRVGSISSTSGTMTINDTDVALGRSNAPTAAKVVSEARNSAQSRLLY